MTIKLFSAVIGAALLLSAAPAGAQGESDTILPGYWEHTSSASLVFTTKKTEFRCVRPQDVAKFFNGPSNRLYKCTYPTRIVGDGKARFEGTCVSKNGRHVEIAASGTYTPTSFDLAGQLRTKFAGVPIAPTGRIVARRIGDTCPPGAKVG
jgi:hypothetical protein